MFGVDNELNAKLHEKGFTNDQVQIVYDLAAEKMVPLVIAMAADYRADREIEKLEQQFGGADKWREVSRQLLAFGQKNLPADVLDTLSSSFEGVMSLRRMMKNEEPGLSPHIRTPRLERRRAGITIHDARPQILARSGPSVPSSPKSPKDSRKSTAINKDQVPVRAGIFLSNVQ